MSDPVPTIRSGVPLPHAAEGRSGVGRPRTPRWRFLMELKVGESANFSFESPAEMRKFRNLLNSQASRYGNRYNRKFTVATAENQLEVGVWRTE